MMKALLRMVGLWMAACLMIVALAPLGSGMVRHHRYRHNPEAGKAKAAKRIGIGAAIGAGAGAIVGGPKGAAIGAGLGAGAGAAYHYHKKHEWRRHHRRY